MPDLFDVEGAHLDIGFLNLKSASSRTERSIKDALEDMWSMYEAYADHDFREGFARDPDGRYWELKLGCDLLESGSALLPVAERLWSGGQPDICVLNGSQRIWIEATAPDDGAPGPDQIVRPVPLNQGGEVIAAPVRQAQLRISSALWTKTKKLERYLATGVIAPEETRIVAVGGGRFGAFVPDEPISLITRTVFPIGDQYVTFDRESGELVDEGYHLATVIERSSGPIPRTAFLDPIFSDVSGVIWSRNGIGNLLTANRPTSFVHNPLANVAAPNGWGPWTREYKAERVEDHWSVHDIRNSDD